MFPDDDKKNLFTFEGDKDKTLGRQMAFGIGTEGIRKSYLIEADGTTHRLSTRAGFPELITENKKTEQPGQSVFARGYVSRIMEITRSIREPTGKTEKWLGVIWRVVGRWAKRLKGPLRGPYSVVDHWTPDTQEFPDVLMLPKTEDSAVSKLYLNGKPLPYTNASEFSSDAMPFLLKNETWRQVGGDDASDFHLFGVETWRVSHLAGRNFDGHPATIYEANELDVGTDAFPILFVPGVDVSRKYEVVNFNHWHMSIAASLKLRFRSLHLLRTGAYCESVGYVDVIHPDLGYMFPDGTPAHSTDTTWDHPVEPESLGMFEQYLKSGTPTPSGGYGTMVADGFYEGEKTEIPAFNDQYTRHGSASYSSTLPIGYYGNTLLSAGISVSVVSDQTWREGNGSYGLAARDYIMAHNEGTVPPPSNYQSRSFDEGGPWNVGDLIGGAVSSSSYNDQSWSSSTTMQTSLPGFGDLYFAQVTMSGEYSRVSTMNSHPIGQFYYQGQSIGLVGTNNPNSSQLNSVKILNQYPGPLPETSIRAETYTETIVSPPYTYSLSASTKDYLLFDVENDTYIYIAGTFSGAKDGAFTMLAEIVIRYNGGIEARKEVFNCSSTGILVPAEVVWTMGTGTSSRYFRPVMPQRLFLPPFCTQGLCNYVAYSEAPDLTGDIDSIDKMKAFIFSIPLSFAITGDDNLNLPISSFAFTLYNFLHVVGIYGGFAAADALHNEFKEKTYHIHFADGLFYDWPVGVEPKAAAYEHFSECYRT